MLILLPPSEGKTQPTQGPSLDLQSLSFPEFSDAREQLITELIAISQREDALDILKVGARVADDIARQTDLWNLPCAPAYEVYSGVLFNAMDMSNASPSDIKRANRHTLIFSGLFGINHPSDMIPAYRLSMGISLPSSGNTKSFWKKVLADADFSEDELVIDARSGAYRVWDPPAQADHVVINAVRIKNGKRTVVSHHTKHYRGLLAGQLIRSTQIPEDAEELAEFAHILVDRNIITNVELDPPGKTRALTLVENLDLE
ncbi:YaaA family protein [Arcanobacterium buesumense]|uniref:Peroxide stress protein YaaA n=1 Tax=Arcanobacterium buesumense TaxID=2722751 RepID=A0A6H2EKS7_9ACTO|nr:peroxide stress protein YaaA [Arcanobacterium buesumense]QJC21653.1 peroxide stress protein YaaA [Arcanobacterium buesumense]